MKIFVDANILVSVLNKEYPLFPVSSRVLSLADHKLISVYTSPICLAIAFYFAEKKHGTSEAGRRISILASRLSIAACTNETVACAIQNKKVRDFEDGLEYYSAIQAGCMLLVTEDKNDFFFADIPVLNSSELFGYIQQQGYKLT